MSIECCPCEEVLSLVVGRQTPQRALHVRGDNVKAWVGSYTHQSRVVAKVALRVAGFDHA
jgi:hypothetical protein